MNLQKELAIAVSTGRADGNWTNDKLKTTGDIIGSLITCSTVGSVHYCCYTTGKEVIVGSIGAKVTGPEVAWFPTGV